jgi:hypothetical protein
MFHHVRVRFFECPSFMHVTSPNNGDEGIGVDGLKELDPGPCTHDGIHIDDIMEHGPSPIHYELVPSLAACCI